MTDGPRDWQKTQKATDAPVPARRARQGESPEPESSSDKRFEYLGEVGAGGAASVHRVRDKNLLRVVAMKTPDLKRSAKGLGVQRFLREARIHAHLDHPNIVPVHELVTGDEGPLFFIMKLVDGNTMAHWICNDVGRPGGTIDQLHELLLAFLKVCDAVAVAHSRGIVHCDVKPENVMVGSFGQV
jgi:serine/threonine-protein kinase